MLGVAYLHSFGIAHRDLKPSNCVTRARKSLILHRFSSFFDDFSCIFLMFDEVLSWNGARRVAKIIDFGLGAVRCTDEEEWMSEVLGTMAFLAPEVSEQSYGEKCDCWRHGFFAWLFDSFLMVFAAGSSG